jgi:hypothetical protein
MANFTTDFDRAAAGYSPDRVDSLTWAFSELLVEPMKGWAHFELTRQKAEALAASKAPPPPPTPEELAKKPETIEDARARFEILTRGRKPTGNEIAEQEAILLRLHNAQNEPKVDTPPAPLPEKGGNLFELYKQRAALLAGKAAP